MNEDEAFASFWEHAEELRKTLLRVLFVIGTSALLCFACYEPLIAFLTRPFHELLASQEERLEYVRIHNTESRAKVLTLPEHSLVSQEFSHHVEAVYQPLVGKAAASRYGNFQLEAGITPTNYKIAPGGSLVYLKPIQSNTGLVILSPTEGFLTAFKVSLWSGMLLSAPLWAFLLAQFFIPGLRIHERQLILPFITTSIVFIALGCFLAFTVTIPAANHYLASFNTSIGTNLWSLSHYLNYTLFLMLANGIAFELGAVGAFAVHMGKISAGALIAKRRFAIVGAFVLAAILTPPDVLTQFLLAIPLIGLYEALILYARFRVV